MRHIIGILVSLTMLACTGSVNKQSTQVAVSSKKAATNIQVSSANQIGITDFPADTAYPAKILNTGTFHDDEVDKGDEKLNWMGLFKNDKGYYITPVKIKISRVRDDIVDQRPEQKTGWEVKTEHIDTSIFLIAKLDYLRPHGIKSIVQKDHSLLPGDTIKYTLNDVDYLLYATGSKKEFKESPGAFALVNYRVFIKAQINGIVYNQYLVTKANPEYECPVLFIGDIDGDGIPDLIIDTANHENVERPTLYLSKQAKKGQLLRVMGMHTVVGC
jgi:hypothetical protein